jgi:MoxR-like ATPase
VVAALQPLTANKEGQLLLQDGTTVRIPLGWKVAVAYNQGVNYAGTKPINAAMLDRLQPINCPYPERDTEANSLCVQTGASSEDVNRIMDLVDLLRENAEVHGFDLSLRPVIRMIRFRQAGRTWATAFERAILDLVGPPDGIDGEIRTSFKETAIKGGLELWDQESKGNVGVDEFAKRMKECMVVGTEDDVDDSDF